VRTLLATLLMLPLVAVGACQPGGEPGPGSPLTPSSGSASGYYHVTLDTSALGRGADEVEAASLGGIAMLLPQVIDADTVQLMVQGGPHDEPLELVVHGDGWEERVADAFVYDPPRDPLFDHVMSFGASLTQGVNNGTPTFENGLYSPSLQLARVMGAWVPQPLLKPGLFPSMAPESVGPPPECEASSASDFIVASIPSVAEQMQPPGGGVIRYEYGRLDPHIPHGNIGAGNFHLTDAVRPPVNDFGDGLVPTMLGHLAYEPFADFGEPLTMSAIDIIEQEQPTFVFSTDFYGNDCIDGIENLTPLDEFEPDMEELLRRLADTGAVVFLSEMPDTNILPENRDRPEEEQAIVWERVQQYNAILHAEADKHDNVYVVPTVDRVAQVHEEGYVVGGETLTTDMLGGLISLDGLHYTATGYALVASMFALSINEQIGGDVLLPDAEAVLAADPNSPAALAAAGLDPAACADE